MAFLNIKAVTSSLMQLGGTEIFKFCPKTGFLVKAAILASCNAIFFLIARIMSSFVILLSKEFTVFNEFLIYLL